MLYLLMVVLKWLGILILLVTVLAVLFLRFAPTFGAKPNKHTQARINNSPNFNGKQFVNLVATQASTISVGQVAEQSSSNNDNLMWQFLFPPKGKNPTRPIQTQPLELIKADANSPLQTTLENGEFVWLGHSTVLFKANNKTLITDPVFYRASPVPVSGKPFAMTHLQTVDDLPFIDIALISHDHYDHLDHKAIRKIKDKVGHFYVPLGVKAHLQRWGVSSSNISEYDWYESVEIDDTILTFAPTRHFSGRGIKNHRTTLWGSWAIQSPNLSVYFSGDGGYSPEFAKIGQRFGGFDVAFIEDGAYNERWRDVHMLPEESAQAGIDVGAKVVLPIHWGKFDLSTHHWREPIRRIKAAFDNYNATKPVADQIRVATPRIGQVFDLQNLPESSWWEEEA